MELLITSLQNHWILNIVPKLDSVINENIKNTIAKYTLNVAFDGTSYTLPYEVSFKNDYATVVDDELNFVKYKPIIIKERKPLFNIFRLIKEYSDNNDFHVIVQLVCLLSTFKGDEKGVEVLKYDKTISIDSNSFYLEKDKFFTSNSEVDYSISNDLFNNKSLCFPITYFPVNCKIYSHKNTAFTGTIEDCERILFDENSLKELKAKIIKREQLNVNLESEAYFRQRKWEKDYNYYMTENQFKNPEDY